jgi:hypothetical protein
MPAPAACSVRDNITPVEAGDGLDVFRVRHQVERPQIAQPQRAAGGQSGRVGQKRVEPAADVDESRGRIGDQLFHEFAIQSLARRIRDHHVGIQCRRE